jgi:hypothetical protein
VEAGAVERGLADIAAVARVKFHEPAVSDGEFGGKGDGSLEGNRSPFQLAKVGGGHAGQVMSERGAMFEPHGVEGCGGSVFEAFLPRVSSGFER